MFGGTPELPGCPDPTGSQGNRGKGSQHCRDGGPTGLGMSVFSPGLPALFCLSGAAQSSLVPNGSEVGQRGWAEPLRRGASGSGVQRAPGTPAGSHTTGLVPTPCPGETPVSPAQGTRGVSPARLQSPGVIRDPSASPQALNPSWGLDSHGCRLGWPNPGRWHPEWGPWGAGAGERASMGLGWVGAEG